MNEVKELIAFYEERGWNWMLAAEYLLCKSNGGILTIHGHCNCCRVRKVQP